MKTLKIISNIVYWLAISLLVAIAVATAFSVIKGPGGYRFFVVQSGSMEPKIKTGSVVLVVPQNEYKKDDVITFLANPKANLKEAKSTVTHRIFEVKDDEGRATFTTKGDANKTADNESVIQSSVLGKVVLSIPYAGYIIAFSKTQTGFISLIIIPGTLIIYSELMSIKNEIQIMIKKRKENKLSSKKPKKHAKKVV